MAKKGQGSARGAIFSKAHAQGCGLFTHHPFLNLSNARLGVS
jgi:hypothetical protein